MYDMYDMHDIEMDDDIHPALMLAACRLSLVTCHLFDRMPDGCCISYFIPMTEPSSSSSILHPPSSIIQIQNYISAPPVKCQDIAADSCQHNHKHKRS